MTMTDPVADMLTRLRNANSAHHDTVTLPSSKLKTHIAEILNSQVDVVETPEELPRDEAPASVSKPPAAGGQPRRWQDVR